MAEDTLPLQPGCTHSKRDVLGLLPRTVVDGCLHILVNIVHHYPPHTEPQPDLPLCTTLVLEGEDNWNIFTHYQIKASDIYIADTHLGNLVEHIPILGKFLGFLCMRRGGACEGVRDVRGWDM